MPFLREFEDDIFISYAHIDNQPLADGQKGWITSFHKALEIRLSQLLGDEPMFWRDEAKLRGNDYFDDAIILHLPRIAILVTVLTPRFVKSEWCLKEVKEFYRVAEETGGVRVAEKSRIFKVVKTPVPQERHPPELQSVLGYEFYQIDQTTGKPREFIFNSGPNSDNNYWSKLDDLAYDIVEIMGVLKSGGAVERQMAALAATIYLAETTLDLGIERDKIKRDFLQRGYRVLPDRPLPHDAVGFEQMVREDLSRSTLSVHLVGSNYGFIPETSDRSVVCLQNELAAERSHDPTFSRVIWMPPGLEATDPRQQQFIDYLHNDPEAQHGAELLQTTLEDLKTVVQDKFDGASARDASVLAAAAANDDHPPRVYLICDQQDIDDIAPLSDHLFDQGFEVITPIMEGDEAQVRADHKDNLLICDAILIYYGRAGEPWLRTKLLDLRKLAGFGRTKPLVAKAVYVGGPTTPAKERFRTLEAIVIKNTDQFSPESLKPLLAQITSAKGDS
jgi:hypothetical protein